MHILHPYAPYVISEGKSIFVTYIQKNIVEV